MTGSCNLKGAPLPALTAELAAQVESWHPCPHIPGCIVVNVGDSLQAWSDGVLKSNYHRVRMPKPGEPTVRCLPLLLTLAQCLLDVLMWRSRPGAQVAECMHAQPCVAHGHRLLPQHQLSMHSAASQPFHPHCILGSCHTSSRLPTQRSLLSCGP